jgi:hypothetical protein
MNLRDVSLYWADGESSEFSATEETQLITKPASNAVSLKGLFKPTDLIVRNRKSGLSVDEAVYIMDKLNKDGLINGKCPWYAEKVHEKKKIYGIFFNGTLSSPEVVSPLRKKLGEKFIESANGFHEYVPDKDEIPGIKFVL